MEEQSLSNDPDEPQSIVSTINQPGRDYIDDLSPFVCPMEACEKQFKAKSALMRHLQVAHGAKEGGT